MKREFARVRTGVHRPHAHTGNFQQNDFIKGGAAFFILDGAGDQSATAKHMTGSNQLIFTEVYPSEIGVRSVPMKIIKLESASPRLGFQVQ